MIAEEVKKLELENSTLRTQLEQLQELYGDRAELPKNCEYCQNFIQHYFKSGTQYCPTCDGHCVAGNRMRKRKTDETCKAFVRKPYGKNYV